MNRSEFDIATLRYQEMVGEAENYRLSRKLRETERNAKQKVATDIRVQLLIAPLLIDLGLRLVEIGQNLKSPYIETDCHLCCEPI